MLGTGHENPANLSVPIDALPSLRNQAMIEVLARGGTVETASIPAATSSSAIGLFSSNLLEQCSLLSHGKQNKRGNLVFTCAFHCVPPFHSTVFFESSY